MELSEEEKKKTKNRRMTTATAQTAKNMDNKCFFFVLHQINDFVSRSSLKLYLLTNPTNII